MEDGIQRARADAISVPGQLFDHAETEDLPFHSVVKDVKPDESGVQVSIVRSHTQVGIEPTFGCCALL
jgi:hypothetical protein